MNDYLGEILTREFGVPVEKVEEALRIQSEKGGRIGEVLIKLKAVTEENVFKALSLQFEIPFVHITPQQIDRVMFEKITASYAKRNMFVILKNDSENSDCITLSTAEPQNLSLLTDIQRIFEKPVNVCISTPTEIESAINTVYGEKEVEASEVIEEAEAKFVAEVEEIRDIIEETGDAPIIRFMNALLFQGVRERASDIHIEPSEKDVAVRLRVDGVLYEVMRIPKNLHEPVASRVKVMSKLDIAEKRIPQDGKIRLKVAGKDIDVRVSTLPTVFGERVSLRLLDRASTLLSLEDIGMNPEALHTVSKLIKKSYGMILVTGPTGSGKTTTLYACLDKINSPDKNIITIEDPIEYQLKGINQIQVNTKVGLTFAKGLRSILRQDPDIIMVGEIRDAETASIAIHASLTGHLVFSTLHTNDAPGAITRLIDMGIEPYLISSSVIAILAQRLIRMICPNCKEPYSPRDEELQELGIGRDSLSNNSLFRGRGCKICMNTGYKGRTGVFELLLVTDTIRTLTNRAADSSEIKRAAREEGMKTLKEDGIDKTLRGITTVQEVTRVTQEI